MIKLHNSLMNEILEEKAITDDHINEQMKTINRGFIGLNDRERYELVADLADEMATDRKVATLEVAALFMEV